MGPTHSEGITCWSLSSVLKAAEFPLSRGDVEPTKRNQWLPVSEFVSESDSSVQYMQNIDVFYDSGGNLVCVRARGADHIECQMMDSVERGPIGLCTGP